MDCSHDRARFPQGVKSGPRAWRMSNDLNALLASLPGQLCRGINFQVYIKLTYVSEPLPNSVANPRSAKDAIVNATEGPTLLDESDGTRKRSVKFQHRIKENGNI